MILINTVEIGAFPQNGGGPDLHFRTDSRHYPAMQRSLPIALFVAIPEE
jgi:hypothetical protein